jgi:hypothetical protein
MKKENNKIFIQMMINIILHTKSNLDFLMKKIKEVKNKNKGSNMENIPVYMVRKRKVMMYNKWHYLNYNR